MQIHAKRDDTESHKRCQAHTYLKLFPRNCIIKVMVQYLFDWISHLVAEFLKAADTQTHASAKFATTCPKLWLFSVTL